jgi:integrase
MEYGQERERCRSKLLAAKELADTTAGQLALNSDGAVSDATAFGALADAWIAMYSPDWSKGHTANMESILDTHFLPTLANLPCHRVGHKELSKVIREMAKDGYSHDWIGQSVGMLRRLCKWGISKGVWPAAANPAEHLKVPQISRFIPKTMIPTIDHIDQLQDLIVRTARTEDQKLRRDWLIVAARGTGIRWGELQVLDLNDVDLDKGIVSITKAWHEKELPADRLGPPKSRHSVRDVPIPDEDMDLWEQIIEATPEGEYFAQTLKGCVWTNSNFNNKVMHPAKAKVEGWPPGAGFHFLRHYALTNMLDCGIPIGDVSRIAGHHSTSFTYDRYVGPKVDYASSARSLLRIRR